MFHEEIHRLGKYGFNNLGIWLNAAIYDLHSISDVGRKVFLYGIFPVDAITNKNASDKVFNALKDSLNAEEKFMAINAFSTFTHEKRHFVDFHSTPLGMYVTGQQLNLNLAALSVLRILEENNVTSVRIPYLENYSNQSNELPLHPEVLEQMDGLINHIKLIQNKINTFLIEITHEGINSINILEGLAIIQQYNIIRDCLGQEYSDFFLHQLSESSAGDWYLKSINYVKHRIPNISFYSISLILYYSLFGHITWDTRESQNPPKILSNILDVLDRLKIISESEIQVTIENNFNVFSFSASATSSYMYSYKSSLNHISVVRKDIIESKIANTKHELFYLDVFEKSIEAGKLYYGKFYNNKRYYDSIEFGKDYFLTIPVFIESDVGFVLDPKNAKYFNPIIQHPMTKDDVVKLPFISYEENQRLRTFPSNTIFWQVHLAEISKILKDEETKEIFREMLFIEILVFGFKSYDIISLVTFLEKLVTSKIKIIK